MLASELDHPLLRGQLVVVQDEDCSPGNLKAIAQFHSYTDAGRVRIVYRNNTARAFIPADVYVLPTGWNAAGDAKQWPLTIPLGTAQKRAKRSSLQTASPELTTEMVKLVAEALAVRALCPKCPACDAVLVYCQPHAESCAFYSVEQVAKNARGFG